MMYCEAHRAEVNRRRAMRGEKPLQPGEVPSAHETYQAMTALIRRPPHVEAVLEHNPLQPVKEDPAHE